jgi:hypothetical protein
MTPAATTDIPRPRVRFEAYVPNREAAERFINTIARSLDTRLCWLFHDTKELVEEHGLPPMSERTTPPVFSGAVNGTLAEVWDRIVATQAAGGSVSLRLNVRPPNADGNGGGLEVYYFRAFYLDFDCDAAATNAKLDAMRVCPPTVLTNSRRGGHPYWALQNNPEANTISESEWRAVQAALTEHFGGDPNLKHPGSQLRLPGTWNFKDPQKPHLLTAFIDPSRRYTPAQVLAAFNLTPVEPPPRREPRPLTGALREAVEKWMFDHGADMEVRKHARCPVCEGDGGCKPYDESQTRLICFSTHHEATGIGTQVGTGFVFSALDIARGDTPLSAFLRQQKDEDGSPYLVDERDGNDSESCRHLSAEWTEMVERARAGKPANEQHHPEPVPRREVAMQDRFASFACRASDVKEEAIDWLTPGWVVAGKLHLVEGDKGCAKSTVTLDAASAWSRGRGWLGGASRPPANVLIVAPEDGLADTIVPRLRAADADLDRVFIQRVDTTTPVFPEIVTFLEDYIAHNGVQYLIIDSLMSCMGAKNAHKDQDVRDALMPLRAMLERTGCTALAIRHLNKNVGAAAGHRGMGSVAFAAIARLVWLLVKDPENEGQFVLSRSAGNLGRRPASRIYSVTASSADASDVRIVWGLETDRSADDLVAKPEGASRGSKRKDAEDLLRERLARGPMKARDLERLADQEGISRATLHRARESMFIEANMGTWRLLTPEDQSSPEAAELQRCVEAAHSMESSHRVR